MKTLASCNPKEFLVQTNKIRKSVANWLTLTKVLEIRKRVPAFPDNATDEEKAELTRKQVKENIEAMLDSVLDEYPEQTAELLGLLCFIDPEDLEKHKMTEFMGAITELLNSPEVLDFFISLARLEKIDISGIAKR